MSLHFFIIFFFEHFPWAFFFSHFFARDFPLFFGLSEQPWPHSIWPEPCCAHDMKLDCSGTHEF